MNSPSKLTKMESDFAKNEDLKDENFELEKKDDES